MPPIPKTSSPQVQHSAGAYCLFVPQTAAMVKSGGTSSAASSVVRVLGVTELRERILLGPSIQDLFVLQRVCKTWQDTIKDSITISQRMFLQPIGPAPQSSSGTNFQINRITMNPASKVYQYKAKTKWLEISQSYQVRIDLQLLVGHGYTHSRWPGLANDQGVEYSFKDMYLTQPPVTNVEIGYEDWREGGVEDFSLVCPDGVTLGELRDHCLDLWKRFHHEPGSCSTGIDSFMGFTVVVQDPDVDA